MARRPLTTRPLDLVYFTFFLIHIPASLLIDLQALYPRNLVPEFLQRFMAFYISLSGDPLISGSFHKTDLAFTWFRSFLWLELLFQVPVFIFGARALWKDISSVYILLLIYGASTSTTTLPCITTVLAVPKATNSTMALGVTDAQRLLLLASYLPFLLIPLVMTLDMTLRLSKITASHRSCINAAARIKREE